MSIYAFLISVIGGILFIPILSDAFSLFKSNAIRGLEPFSKIKLGIYLSIAGLSIACKHSPRPARSASTSIQNIAAVKNESTQWKRRHPEWIFSDDFESDESFVKRERYLEYNDNKGNFIPVRGTGIQHSTAMRVKWKKGEVEAGNLKLFFGKVPDSSMSKGISDNKIFREIYYRMYLRMEDDWEGNPCKLSRATVLTSSDWSQAMIAHLWQNATDGLGIDPATGVDSADRVCVSGYNDFKHLSWLGAKNGPYPIFRKGNTGSWHCVEAHVLLNDPGQANGIQEFWIDGILQARSDRLNFVGNYVHYGINAIFFENYWNTGSPKEQVRYFDNIVVSTQRIGF